MFGRRIVIIAEPHAGNEVTRITNKPGVAEVLARAGLAGGLPARQFRLARRAGEQGLLHHRIHHRHILRLDDAAIRRTFALIEQLAVGAAHFQDDVRLHADTAIGKRRIGGDEFERRHFRRAERDRGVRLQVGRNAEPMRDLRHRFRSHFDSKPHGDGIER